MHWFLVVCIVVFCPLILNAAPQGNTPESIAIISQTNDIQPDGSYEWSYESANSIKAQETGSVKKTNNAESPEVIVAQGSFSYTDPEGNQISLTYSADDEGGFQPQGAHLPTPPPIPPNIQKALDWIAQQPSTPEPK